MYCAVRIPEFMCSLSSSKSDSQTFEWKVKPVRLAVWRVDAGEFRGSAILCQPPGFAEPQSVHLPSWVTQPASSTSRRVGITGDSTCENFRNPQRDPGSEGPGVGGSGS